MGNGDDNSDDVPRVPAGNPNGGQWTESPLSKLQKAREGSAKISDLFERIRKPDGGFTYQPLFDDEPVEGFCVATHPERGSQPIPIDSLTFDQFFDYALRNQDLLSRPDHYMGAWHDPKTGLVYLDISQVTKSRGEAERLATQHRQIAYFDLGSGRSVDVMRPGPS